MTDVPTLEEQHVNALMCSIVDRVKQEDGKAASHTEDGLKYRVWAGGGFKEEGESLDFPIPSLERQHELFIEHLTGLMAMGHDTIVWRKRPEVRHLVKGNGRPSLPYFYLRFTTKQGQAGG